ncbi:MAG: L-threonylcarbamoyladenylate synthase [Desulfobacterales bacterium]
MSKRQQPSNFNSRFVSIDPVAPEQILIRQAAELIKTGRLVAFPTRALYGIGADIYQPDAVSRVFQAKRRAADKPVSVLIRSEAQLNELADDIPETARRLMHRFWPGLITLVFAAGPNVPLALTGNTGKIGIRMPAHPVADALLAELTHPITGTSANLSGEPGCAQISELALDVANKMAMILDAGPLAGGAGSTVVDVTADPPVVLREGGVSEIDILNSLK